MEVEKDRFSHRDENDWNIFERNKIAGFYNIYDPRSQIMTGLTKERYDFILGYYEEIQNQINNKK